MYAICRELHPATGIEFAVNCRFLDCSEENLVTSSTNYLKIFQICQRKEGSADLQCVLTVRLNDRVLAMDSTTRRGKGRDTLFLVFRKAKLVVLDFDVATFELRTTLTCDLDDTAVIGSWKTHCQAPLVRVDPQNTCVAVLVNGQHLAFLPIIVSGSTGKSLDPDPTFVSLNSMDSHCQTAHDVKFLSGFHHPSLCIIMEPLRSWCNPRDSCKAIVVSVDLPAKLFPVIWTQDRLPSDTQQVFPVPSGGVVIVGVNFMMYVDQSFSLRRAVSMNSMSNLSTSIICGEQYPYPVTLDGCVMAALGNDCFIQILRGGVIHLVQLLHHDPTLRGSVTGFQIQKIGETTLPSCLVKCDSGFIFVGSRLSDSVLAYPIHAQNTTHAVVSEPPTFIPVVQLRNIGPVSNSCVGLYTAACNPCGSISGMELELALASGYGKHGSLNLLTRRIRPHILQSIPIEGGGVDIFTIRDHILISQEQTTKVFTSTSGGLLASVDDSRISKEETLYARDFREFVLHISTKAVKLFLESNTVLDVTVVDPGDDIRFVSVQSHNVLFLTSTGKAMIGTFNVTDDDSENVEFHIGEIGAGSVVQAGCLFQGLKRIFGGGRKVTFEMESRKSPLKYDDEEERFLYGGGEMEDLSTEPLDTMEWTESSSSLETFAFLVTNDGQFNVVSVLDAMCVFSFKGIHDFPKVLHDLNGGDFSVDPAQRRHSKARSSTLVANSIEELMVLEPVPGRIFLIMWSDSQGLVIYERFSYRNSSSLKFSWRRIQDVVPVALAKPLPSQRQGRMLRPFENMDGNRGLFICGLNPHWLFFSDQGEIYLHPQMEEEEVNSFIQFNNSFVRNRFAYMCSENELRLGTLPSHSDYASPWVCRRVKLRSTPYCVSYHRVAACYILVASKSVPSSKYCRFSPNEGREFVDVTELERERFPVISIQRFGLIIVPSRTSKVGRQFDFTFEEWEHVTCCKVVELSSDESGSGREYLACGTSLSYGEDIRSVGRILLFAVTKHHSIVDLELVYAEEQRSPVTALCQCQGLLCTAVGHKIFLWALRDNRLTPVTFVNAMIYVIDCVAIKNFILVADVLKSVSLLRYQAEYRTLSLVSADPNSMEVLACSFLVDGPKVGFLAAANDETISVLQYKLESPLSHGGTRLRGCDFKINFRISSFVRLACSLTQSNSYPYAKDDEAVTDRHVTYFLSLDGHVGFVLPLKETTFKRLVLLEAFMDYYLRQPANIRSIDSTKFRSSHGEFSVPRRNVLDGNLFFLFPGLPRSVQNYIAYRIGLTCSEILDEIVQIDNFSSHF